VLIVTLSIRAFDDESISIPVNSNEWISFNKKKMERLKNTTVCVFCMYRVQNGDVVYVQVIRIQQMNRPKWRINELKRADLDLIESREEYRKSQST